MPSRSNASAEQRHRRERLGRLLRSRPRPAPAGMPGADQLAGAAVAAALGDGGGHEVAGAGEARRRSRCGRRWRRASSWTSEKIRPGGGAGQVGAPQRGGRGGERGGVLGARGQLGAGHVVGGLHARGRRPRAPRPAGGAGRRSRVASTTEAPQLDRLARVRGAAEAGHGARAHALGHVGGRRGAERRHEALRGRRAPRCARPRARRCRPTAAGRLAAGHGEHHQVDAGELDLAHGLHARCARSSSHARAGSAEFSRSASERSAWARGAAAELDLEPGAREHRRRPRCPSSRRPPRPRCAAAAGRRATPTGARRRARCARSPRRRGTARGRSTRGKVSGAPKRRCTFTGRMRQPRRACSLPVTAIGTTGAPLSSARRPTPRLGVPSEPVRMRVPSGKITTAWPRSSSAERGLHRLLVRRAAPDREGAQAVEEPAEQRVLEQLLLGDEVDRPAEAAADHERVEEAAVVRRRGSRRRRGCARGRGGAGGSRARIAGFSDQRAGQYTSEFTPRLRVRSW